MKIVSNPNLDSNLVLQSLKNINNKWELQVNADNICLYALENENDTNDANLIKFYNNYNLINYTYNSDANYLQMQNDIKTEGFELYKQQVTNEGEQVESYRLGYYDLSLGIQKSENYLKTYELVIRCKDCRIANNSEMTSNNRSNEESTEDNQLEMEDQWTEFLKVFLSAIETKNIKTVIKLSDIDTSMCEDCVANIGSLGSLFNNYNSYTGFKRSLNENITSFTNSNGKEFKATGDGKTGEYNFSYTKGRWFFEGIIGD